MKNILFVGAFNKRNRDLPGGQLFASKSIINSNLSNKYNFIKLCSSQRSIPPPNIIIRIYDSIIRLFSLLKILMLNKIDIALIFTSNGLGFVEKGIMTLICKKLKIKTVLFPRSGLIINDVKSKLFQRFLKIVINNTNLLIVQGESWLNFYKSFNNEKNIKIQQNWIDYNKYKIINRKFFKEKVNILFLGWVYKEKGIFDLLFVFKNILKKKHNYNINLFVAGMGKDYDLLQSQIKKFNLTKNVKLLGWVNEKNKMKLLKKIDIYVCPSYFEGFPNSLLECLASGIPSISTKVGSVPDIISHGYNGFLYNPGDKSKLEYLLFNLIRDVQLRKKFSINSEQKIKNNNSIQIATKMLDRVFQKL